MAWPRTAVDGDWQPATAAMGTVGYGSPEAWQGQWIRERLRWRQIGAARALDGGGAAVAKELYSPAMSMASIRLRDECWEEWRGE